MASPVPPPSPARGAEPLREFPMAADAYELIEEVGKGVSATVRMGFAPHRAEAHHQRTWRMQTEHGEGRAHVAAWRLETTALLCLSHRKPSPR
jgi:hypothetical protein